jgi:hypothetical protein
MAELGEMAYRPLLGLIAGVEHPEQPLGRLVGSYRTKRGIDQREPWSLAMFERSERSI